MSLRYSIINKKINREIKSSLSVESNTISGYTINPKITKITKITADGPVEITGHVIVQFMLNLGLVNEKGEAVESTDAICFAEYDMQHNTGELTDMMAHPSLKKLLNIKDEQPIRKLFEFDYILGYIEPVSSGDFVGKIR